MIQTIDISEAMIYHLSWKIRLKEFLDGKANITEAQALSHKKCDLGKWLYADVMKKYSDDPEIQDLEKVHTEFHETVNRILKMKYSGNVSIAEQEFIHMELLSEKIFSLLLSIRSRYE
jgi:methyl-accepting chemotaxis protein